jgi:hypothetical protein
MLTDIFLAASAFGAFYGIDVLLTVASLEGVYYILHAIHNTLIVAATTSEVITTLTAFPTIGNYDTNMVAVDICIALHAYHIARYWRKFRADDWLHHILMITVAIPIGVYLNSHTLMGFSLFFTTGLPGGIDYACLALVRNGRLHRLTEKRINEFLNVWIRSPGCIAQAILTIAFTATLETTNWCKAAALIPAALNYWNGQYFMRQVVRDLALTDTTRPKGSV